MPCCSWEQFKEDLPHVWLSWGGVDTVLIDWDKAEIAWKKHHATPREFAQAEINDMKSEGDYIRLTNQK